MSGKTFYVRREDLQDDIPGGHVRDAYVKVQKVEKGSTSPMTQKERQFTAKLLKFASDTSSCRGCNDLPTELRNFFNQEEWDKLNKEMHDWNGDPEEYRPGEVLSYDWLWLSFMSHKITLEHKRIETLEKGLRGLLNKVNKVTACHRGGLGVSKEDLDELSNRQIEVEEAVGQV